MEPLSVAIGAAAIVFGAYTFYVRASNPSRFAKLEDMKKRFGDGAGVAIHTVAYSLVPIGFGIVSLVLGLSGRSILGG